MKSIFSWLKLSKAVISGGFPVKFYFPTVVSIRCDIFMSGEATDMRFKIENTF